MNNDLTRTVFGDQLGIQMVFAEAIELIHQHGLLNIGELAEKAISLKSNTQQAQPCQEGFDLVNEYGATLEIKHGQTHLNTRNNGMVAWLSKKNKTSQMLAVVTETVSKKQYYFSIPYSAYSQVGGNAFDIVFDLDGTPIKYRPRSRYNWWRYQVASFDELCQIASGHKEAQ